MGQVALLLWEWARNILAPSGLPDVEPEISLKNLKQITTTATGVVTMKMQNQYYHTPDNHNTRAEITYINGLAAVVRSVRKLEYNVDKQAIVIESVTMSSQSLGGGNVKQRVNIERIILKSADVRAVTLVESVGNLVQSVRSFNIHPNTITNVVHTTKKNKILNPNTRSSVDPEAEVPVLEAPVNEQETVAVTTVKKRGVTPKRRILKK
jgi:hypothetical protein